MKLSAFLTGVIASSMISTSVEGESEELCRIVLDKYDRAAMHSRNFLIGRSNKWPGDAVPYTISSAFSSTQRQKIEREMKRIQDNSCIKFVRRSSETTYLEIISEDQGCYAYLGYNPFSGARLLNLERNGYCMSGGTIAHELLHALGFAHEHTRPDRDKYIHIYWKKILTKHLKNWYRNSAYHESVPTHSCNEKNSHENFDKCVSGFFTDGYGMPYDYGSVMHYGQRAGSQDGEVVMKPLKTVPPGVRIGQRKRPSNMDMKKLNKAYNCPRKITTTQKTSTSKASTTLKPQTCKDEFRLCTIFVKYCNTFESIASGCRLTCGKC